MSTFYQVLETALQLPYEQQQMLIQILQNRHHESCRAEIATDAQQTLTDFRAGKFKRQSAEEVIAILRQSLHEPEV
jgi:2,3-bisphosphoglycerate-independent phosphoglycerate mutase